MERFRITLLHSTDRGSDSWILSESEVEESVIESLVFGHHSVLDVCISEQAICVLPVTALPRREGRINKRVAFLPVSQVTAQQEVVLVNSPFLDILDGDSMFEKLAELAPVMDVSDAAVQELFFEMASDRSFHCVGVMV